MFKKSYRYILLIILYFMCQCGFFILILNHFGINYKELSATYKNIILIIDSLIYVGILLYLFRKEIKFGINDLKKHFKDRAYTAIMCWAIGFLIMGISSIIISYILKEPTSGNEAIIRAEIKKAPIYMIISCCVTAPLFEELLFRKMPSTILKNKYLFIIFSGLIFGLLHVIGTSSSPLEYLYIIPYGAMGSSFAYLLYKTDNLTLPILVHMLHNTILVLRQIIGG